MPRNTGKGLIRVAFPIDVDDPTKLAKETDMTTQIEAAMAAVKDDLEPTEMELEIAARIHVTRDELITQKAKDRLVPEELVLLKTGMTAIEILARR